MHTLHRSQSADRPHPFAQQANAVTDLMKRPGNKPLNPEFCEQIGQVVVVVCSPRSGSSLLASIFRRTDQLLTFQGAITPFLGLANLRYPESGDSDALDESHLPIAQANGLPALLAQDCGTPDELHTPESLDRFIIDLSIRLSMQWPELRFDPDQVGAATRAALEQLYSERGWPRGRFLDLPLFHAVFLRQLRHTYPGVNPYLYDLDKALIHEIIPDAIPTNLLPSERFIEMPPFILIRPWRAPSADDLARKPLIIKTVANTFRLPFLKALFPNARFRILHLTRSVAASANGMYDGYLFPGFWAARVDQPLSIPGYSDRFPQWGGEWLKFGLIPGWRRWTDKPLEQVCANHWRTCHQTILDWLDSHPEIRTDALRLKFEDLLGSPAQKAEAYARLTDWLGIELDESLTYARDNDLPLQLATAKPAPERWRQRYDIIAPLLEDPRNRRLMERLGYRAGGAPPLHRKIEDTSDNRW
ncbi:hypothetical protein [Allochromatium palmeri]|uniref:Sulfotransferase n=1 Tax=Allochromatium palmeri TaxID=231048 RepID=A0A6N8EKV4_9GAMM|nr:hypothetical protein [Allochromatium palmeri]MTW23197.1 hypothetical protein [Allochromatium palmeri]